MDKIEQTLRSEGEIFNEDLEFTECWQCGGSGVHGHECGEDCCVCLDKSDNVICDVCDGRGCWERTESDQDEEEDE